MIRGVARSLDPTPVRVGIEDRPGQRTLVLPEGTAGVAAHHCTLRRAGGELEVEGHSTLGTFVNDRRIEEPTAVWVGDSLRLGSPGIELQLIAVESADGET